MPIFSSQLGKVENMSPEKGIKTVANHLRKVQEELEYRLMHLDSSNISEINAKDTNILLDDGDGNFSEFKQNFDEISARVGDNAGNIASLIIRADSITSRVEKTEENLTKYSTIEQTAESIGLAVKSIHETTDGKLEKYSTLELTDSKIEATVKSITESTDSKLTKYSTIEQTDGKIEATVKSISEATDGKLEKYSTITQTDSKIATAVSTVNSTTDGKLEKYSTIEQTDSKISTAVSSVNTTTDGKLEKYSTITQTDSKISTAVSSSKEYTDQKIAEGLSGGTVVLESYSTIEQTDSKIATAVASSKTYTDEQTGVVTEELKKYSTITQTDEKIATAVSTSQTYTDSKTGEITSQLSKYSTIEQTDSKIATAVSESNAYAFDTSLDVLNFVEEKYSTIKQTATSISTAVVESKSYTDEKTGAITSELTKYSTIEQTTEAIEAAVVDVTAGQSTMLRLDADGVYVVDGEGNEVSIQGSQIAAATITGSKIKAGTITGSKIAAGTIEAKHLKAETIVAGSLYGENIWLFSEETDSYGDNCVAGWMSITGARTANYAVNLTSFGAMRLEAEAGAMYLGAEEGHISIEEVDNLGYQISCGTDLIPSDDLTYDCGDYYYQWNKVWADEFYAITSCTCNSDRNKKNSISYDMERYDSFFDKLQPATYKLNAGTSGRFHVGMIAQDVEQALEECEIPTSDFAAIVKREDGYALRYDEFIGLLIWQVQKLKARVAVLEEARA